jgi:hypothetical protein
MPKSQKWGWHWSELQKGGRAHLKKQEEWHDDKLDDQ